MINETSNKALPIQLSVTPVAIKTEQTVEDRSRKNVELKEVAAIESEGNQSENIQDTVNRLNNIVQSIERDLNFRVDEASGKTVITVLDSKTEVVIRQIPADHVLALSENIESLKGILFSVEV